MPASSSGNELFESAQIAEGLTLHHHRSSKWKGQVVRFVFCRMPDEKVAARALGAHLLRHGHAKCRGLEKVSTYFRDLYGANLGSQVALGSSRHLLTLRSDVVSGRHLPRQPKTLEKAMEFLGALIRDPWCLQANFDVDVMERERANLLRALDALRDDKGRYADVRLREEMFKGTLFARSAQGRREEVAALQMDEIADALRGTLHDAPLMIYSVGDRSTAAMAKLVKKEIGKVDRKPMRVRHAVLDAPREKPRRIVERDDIAQCRLSLGFRVRDYDAKKDVHAGLLGDVLFGGSSTSKLFKEVREKRSLAYSIWSSFEESTGSLIVSAGVDQASLGKVTTLVKAQIRAMAREQISDEEVGAARAAIQKSLSGIWDAQDSMIQFDLASRLRRRRERTPEALIARYDRTKIARVADLFSRLELDTVFRLEGNKA